MLSILIPNRSEPHIHAFIDECEKILQPVEIIISNDPDGKGKGWALREAFLQSKGDQIAFIDGDRDLVPRMLLRLLPFIEDFDVCVGSKRLSPSAPLRRKIMTHVSRVWFRLLFGLPFDTQTGIKLFRRKALESLKDWSCNSFLFDIELLYQINSKGLKIIEVPVEADIRRQLPLKTIFSMFFGSFLLWLKLKTGYRAKGI